MNANGGAWEQPLDRDVFGTHGDLGGFAGLGQALGGRILRAEFADDEEDMRLHFIGHTHADLEVEPQFGERVVADFRVAVDVRGGHRGTGIAEHFLKLLVQPADDLADDVAEGQVDLVEDLVDGLGHQRGNVVEALFDEAVELGNHRQAEHVVVDPLLDFLADEGIQLRQRIDAGLDLLENLLDVLANRNGGGLHGC